MAVTDEHSSWTYNEIGHLAHRFAAALHQLAVRKGDRVTVLSETRPDYVVTYAALAPLGAMISHGAAANHGRRLA